MAARKTRASSGQTETTSKRAVARRTAERGLALPSDMQDEFDEYVNRDRASAVAGGWPWISTQGSAPQMRLGGQEAEELSVIVLGANRSNMYWEEEFRSGVFTPPKCYAIAHPSWKAGEVEEKLAPPADLKTRQAESCAKCDWNAFGSARRGRGKACSNTVRLAMIPADAKLVDKVEGAMLSVPPTSLRMWTQYARQIVDGLNRPVGTAVTRIRKVPNKQGAGFTFEFEMDDVIRDKELLRKILARMKGDAELALQQPPPTVDAETSRAASGGGRARRKVNRRKSKAVGGAPRAPRAR